MDEMQNKHGLDYSEAICVEYSKSKQIVYFRSSIFKTKSPAQLKGLMLHELAQTLQQIT